MKQNQEVWQQLISDDQAGMGESEILKRYRVLKKISIDDFNERFGAGTKSAESRAVIIDVETTGLGYQNQGVTQVAMIEVFYQENRIIRIGNSYKALHDPEINISHEATLVTGIENSDVQGRSIDPRELTDFIGSRETLLIAHNASFDRPALERDFFPQFQANPWACSLADVNWLARGLAGKLELALCQLGYFYEAHDALEDVIAVAYLLNHVDERGQTAWSELVAGSDAKGGMIQVALDGKNKRPNVFEHFKNALSPRGFRYKPALEAAGGRASFLKSYKSLTSEDAESDLSYIESETIAQEVIIYEVASRDRFTNRTGAAITKPIKRDLKF